MKPSKNSNVWQATATRNLQLKRARLEAELSKKKQNVLPAVSINGVSTTIVKRVKIDENSSKAGDEAKIRNSKEYQDALRQVFGVTDPYDPSRPNEYYAVIKLRKEQKRNDKKMKEAAQLELTRQKLMRNKPQNAPQPISTETVEEEEDVDGIPIDIDVKPTTSEKKGNIAAKMMEKMGWTIGKGLGKSEQGIVAPLVHQKIDRTTGVIVEAEPQFFPIKKSQVVVLLNMVLSGMVDSELESEVRTECSKYGIVNKVSIFESLQRQQVRIFVKFSTETEAQRAIDGLNGRLFDGRTVRALFYDFEAFETNKLWMDL